MPMAQAMSAKSIVLLMIALTLLSGCASPERASISVAKPVETIKRACGARDGWSDKAPPQIVFANTYMVGTCGITALLITTPEGHFLIDGATQQAAPGIADNIRKLGFDPSDIRYLLVTHEHLDHAGGLAELKRISGARFAIREAARAAMETGLPREDDPQYGIFLPFPGIKADRIISDGESLRIGNQIVNVIATPGHAPGGTSYSWKSCKDAVCRRIVYADSLSAVSADDYRFSDHPEYLGILRRTIARIAAITDCDILISPHPSQSNFFERLAGEMPLVDPAGCKAYSAAAGARLDARLAKEFGK